MKTSALARDALAEKEYAMSTIDKIKKTCRVFSIIVRVIVFFYLAWWLFASIAAFFSLAGVSSFQSGEVNLPDVLFYALHGLTITSLLIIFERIFSEAANGTTPFTMKQVRRLRIIAALLLALALIETATSFFAPQIYFNRMAPAPSIVANSSSFSLDLSPLIGAALIYAISFVFKYGVLLQEDSDEII